MKSRTRIKMCGTTRVEDAGMAVAAGVDAVGFIFAEKSPRYIQPEEALTIVRAIPPFVDKIGVFVDSSHQDIEEIVRYLGLNGVQLHGGESPEFCEKAAQLMPSCMIIKAIRIGQHTSSADFSAYQPVVSGFLLDTYVENREGGTGLAFDWHVLQGLEIEKPFILAGGLNPENIVQALQVAHPFGIDVNSGVEDSPGKKNHSLLRQLVERVMDFDRQRLAVSGPQ